MLEPDFSDQLVYFSSDMKQLFFPLNTLSRGEREKAIAHTMRSAVEKSGAREVKVPVWWYVLELLLQELSKELGRGVLSRAECLQMARSLAYRKSQLMLPWSTLMSSISSSIPLRSFHMWSLLTHRSHLIRSQN